MALGLINLNNKDDLSKLGKEELIDILLDKNKQFKNIFDQMVNFSEKELIAFQKNLKTIIEVENKLSVWGLEL
jgi:hypothetical protein